MEGFFVFGQQEER